MKRIGFSLVELLVCVAVLACLAGLLFPAVQAVREAARSAQCKANLHQLGIYLHDRECIAGRIEQYDQYEDAAIIQCPTATAERGFAESWYAQDVTLPDTRTQIIESLGGVSSSQIGIVDDVDPVHSNSSTNVLYLDWHVAHARH